MVMAYPALIYTISYLSTVKILSCENVSSPPSIKEALATCNCQPEPNALEAEPTSTSGIDPEATKPMLTGKKASASPSHRNSRLPVEESASMVSMVQTKALRSARQSASPVTDGR
jgi:hypothetical protein